MIRTLGRGAAAVVSVVVVVAFVWLALAVGGRILTTGTQQDPALSPTPITAADAPTDAPTEPSAPAASTSPTAAIEPTAEPTTETTIEPTAEPTAEPTPRPTPKPTHRPTAPPQPDPNPEPTPRSYTVSGSFDETIAIRDMTVRAVHVPVPGWAQGIDCTVSGMDTAGAMEVTVTWPGHTKIPSVGIGLIGSNGEDEFGAVGAEDTFDWRSGEPKVVAYCYVSKKAKLTLVQVDRTGGGSVPIIYEWRLH